MAEICAALLDHGRGVRMLLVLCLDLEDFVELNWVFLEPLQLGLVIMVILVLVLLFDEVIIVDDLRLLH